MEVRRAAAYIRVSTDEQAELSPESQLEEIRKFAARESIELLNDSIYIDTGISGKRAENRPEFMRMIAAAKSNGCPFSVILLWKYSRFARNQEESIFYKSILRTRCGIDVISVTEPLIEGPFGSLIERIIEWMDEFYSIRLSQEVKRSMRVNAEHGKLQCSASFGYEVREGVLFPKADEAEYVQRIFEAFISGSGTYAIARELNDLGVRTHRGNKFESRTVEYILRNPVYIGKLRWNPSGHTRRDFSNANIIVSDGGHKPIISDETFWTVQSILNRAKTKQMGRTCSTGELKCWISGLVRCSACGATLIFSKPGYYKCNNYSRGRCRYSQHIRADLLENALFSRFKLDCSESDTLSFDCTPRNTQADDIARANDAVHKLSVRKSRLLEAYLEGDIELSAFSAANKELEAALRRAEAELKPTSVGVKVGRQTTIDDASNALSDLSSISAEAKQINTAMRSVIESCIFDKASLSMKVVYRFDVEESQQTAIRGPGR